MEKQIEEMARTLCGEKEHSCKDCDSCDLCEFWVESSTLYNAGYRKQEWIGVEERLPKKSGKYLVSIEQSVFMVVEYSKKHKWFNAHDALPEELARVVRIAPSHWMPLPEPPKGE